MINKEQNNALRHELIINAPALDITSLFKHAECFTASCFQQMLIDHVNWAVKTVIA